jgi:subtilisin-like proprotein convertase family protein
MRMHCLPIAALAVAAATCHANTRTYFGAGFDIPDMDSRGGSSVIEVLDTGVLTNVSISITIEHTFVSDLTATLLRRPGSNNFGLKQVKVFRLVGYTEPAGYGDDSDLDGTYVFEDSAIADFAVTPRVGGVIPQGTYRSSTIAIPLTNDIQTANPFTSLNATFGGLDRKGNWELKIDDWDRFEAGSVVEWSLTLTTAQPVPEPATYAMFACGLLGLAGMLRRRDRGLQPPMAA